MSNLDNLLKGIQVFNQGVTDLATSLATRDAAKQVKQLNAQVQAQTDSMLQQSMGTMPPEEIAKMQQDLFQQQTQARGQIAGNLALGLTKAGANAATIEAATSRIGQAPQQLDQMGFERERLAENARQFDARLGVMDREADAAMLRAENLGKASGGSTRVDKSVEKANLDILKQFSETAKKAPMVNESFEAHKQALNSMRKIVSEGLSTGPLSGAGIRASLGNKTLNEARMWINKMNLGTLIEKFQGLSRSIDSEADRAKFEQSQANLSANNPETNVKAILFGSALVTRLQTELAAQEEHRAKVAKGIATPADYVSPVKGTVSLVDKTTGEITFVPKDIASEDKGKRYADIDLWANATVQGRDKDLMQQAIQNMDEPSADKIVETNTTQTNSAKARLQAIISNPSASDQAKARAQQMLLQLGE